MDNSKAIYLCYSYNTNLNSTPGCFFICKRFASFSLAKSQQECLNHPNPLIKSNYLNSSNLTNQSNLNNPSSAIITVCKYIPKPLHIFVLRYKLSKHFFGIKIY